MGKNQKRAFWVILSIFIFSLFRWLFGIAVPEIALEFSVGITVTLVGGLLVGRAFMNIWLQTSAAGTRRRLMFILPMFMLLTFVVIAFLLNAMIKETEFFHFSVTVLLLFLLAAATGGVVTVLRFESKSKLASARTAMAHSKSELQLLQSQLSPHFLFNTLNNVYGLSLTSPEKVPALLLKLSDLLRYSVYDAKDVFVSIQSEVEYIKNYIEFEKLRLGEHLDLRLRFDDFAISSCRIAPMLLIVFIENAFKHSRTAMNERIVIDIALTQNGNEIVFSSWNSRRTNTMQSPGHEKHSGFGLESVRKRLALLYEGRHELVFNPENDRFMVTLKMQCQ